MSDLTKRIRHTLAVVGAWRAVGGAIVDVDTDVVALCRTEVAANFLGDLPVLLKQALVELEAPRDTAPTKNQITSAMQEALERVLDRGAAYDTPSRAERDVLSERGAQVAAGYDAVHDDQHVPGELALAVRDCAPPAGIAAERLWPWSPHLFGKCPHRRFLVVAAAFIIAEIERLDRLEEKKQ